MRLQFDAWKPVEEQLKIEVQQSHEVAESDLLLKYRERLLRISLPSIRRKEIGVCGPDGLLCSNTQPLVRRT